MQNDAKMGMILGVGLVVAIAVVFFVLIVALSILLLHMRRRAAWNETGGVA